MNKRSRLSHAYYFWESLKEIIYNSRLSFKPIYCLRTYFNIKHDRIIFLVVSEKAIPIGSKICPDVTKLIPNIYTLKIIILWHLALQKPFLSHEVLLCLNFH